MAKFCGKIGYGTTSETSPGVFVEDVIERTYYGDIIKDVRLSQGSENLNDNITVNNRVSIVADAFAYNNFYSMKYVEWMGALWKIKSVDVQRPRLILSIGGVYNG